MQFVVKFSVNETFDLFDTIFTYMYFNIIDTELP